MRIYDIKSTFCSPVFKTKRQIDLSNLFFLNKLWIYSIIMLLMSQNDVTQGLPS